MNCDYRDDETKKKLLADIAVLRADRIGAADSVDVLRELRGYHMRGGNVAEVEGSRAMWEDNTQK